MKRLIALALPCLLAAGVSQSAFATLLTFDDLGQPVLTAVTTQYAPRGVTFQGFAFGGAPVNLDLSDASVFSDNHPPSPPMSLSNFYDGDPGNRAQIMRVMFTDPSQAISLMYNGAGGLGSSTDFNVYSPGGTLLDTITVPSATDTDYHLVTVPDSGVGYLDIVSPGPGWGHYIDDLSFTSVPEPSQIASSLVLLVGGAGYIYRRRLAARS